MVKPSRALIIYQTRRYVYIHRQGDLNAILCTDFQTVLSKIQAIFQPEKHK